MGKKCRGGKKRGRGVALLEAPVPVTLRYPWLRVAKTDGLEDDTLATAQLDNSVLGNGNGGQMIQCNQEINISTLYRSANILPERSKPTGTPNGNGKANSGRKQE